MKAFSRTTLVSIAASVACLTALPQAVLASVTVDDIVLVDRTRVGRTTFEYTYQVVATNNSPVALDAVTAYLIIDGVAPASANAQAATSTSDSTVLIDDVVELGTVPGGVSVTSTDTFKLRQDRRFLLQPDALRWEVGFQASVTLQGVVTDEPIAFARVNVAVDRTESGRPIIESGRPIIESYQTTADENGVYSVVVDFVSGQDFVDITGDGVDDQDFVELNSIVGSAGSIIERATDADGPTGRRGGQIVVNSTELNPLNVTHISTALSALALEANGGQPFTNDTALATAQAQVNNEQLVVAAAVIKTVIDNPGINLPATVTNTAALLADPAAFSAFLIVLQEDFPDELQSAIDETIGEVSVAYVSGELPPVLYLSLVRASPLRSDANVFTFDMAGNATVINSDGQTTDADWSINPQGHIVVDLNNPPVTESFPSLEVPPGSGNFQQVRAQISRTQLRIVRIAVGVQSDQILLGSTTLVTYPDHVGVLPDEITVNEPNPQTGYLAFDTTGIVKYTNAELAGKTVEFTYFHSQNNGSIDGSDPTEGADLLTFDAGGTGATARRQFAFNWSVDTDGRLQIVFSNGDSNEYIRYSQIDQGLVGLGVLVGQVAGTSPVARDSLSVRLVPGAQLDEATLLNHKFRSGSLILEPAVFGPRFDFNFLPNGMGCRDDDFYVRDIEWTVDATGLLVMQRPDFAIPPTSDRQRAWQAVAVLPGILGTRYWVLENLDIRAFDPGVFPSDPTVTPGRVNFYENVQNIAGNTAPTVFADTAFTAADTPVYIDVVANDMDAEGDPILLSDWSNSQLGGSVIESYSADFNQINGLIYTPPPGVPSGVDTFTYGVSDGSCGKSAVDAGQVTVFFGEAGPSAFVPGSPSENGKWADLTPSSERTASPPSHAVQATDRR